MPPIRAINHNQPAALSANRLMIALGVCVSLVVLALLLASGRPGDPLPQLAGAIGAVLLLVPAAFSWHKRAGTAQRPRAWFAAHVLASLFGAVSVAVHINEGSLFSPPGVVVLALVFLVVQGVSARVALGRKYAQLFARAPQSFSPQVSDRRVLTELIQRKVELLQALDPQADEALFSLQWNHWLNSPVRSWQYAALVRREVALVHHKLPVNPVLRYWRRLHLFAAAVFVLGLIAHVLVVIFFAAYAAGDSMPYWWYISAWGAGQ